MSIFPRPLKKVLDKIIPFSQEDKVPLFNLGSGTYDATTVLRGDGVWATPPGLSGYVPYIGATSDVDLGIYKLTADAVEFSLTPTNAPASGQIAYDGASGALAYLLNSSNVLSRIGQTMHAYVHNGEAVTITKGQAVYLFSASGNKASVKLANNTSDATSAKTFGLAAEDIGSNQNGMVICQGVLEGLNTGMYTAGDTLYLGATPGGYTNVKPYAPNHFVYIGIVERANAGNGQIYVRVQNGYELDEIHDVDLITTPPISGDVLTYNGSLWTAVAPSGGGGLTVGTTPIASGTIGRILFENGGNILGQDSALFWDNTNKRLGVGATPNTSTRLDVRAQGALSTDVGLRVRNSGDSVNLMEVRGDGSFFFRNNAGSMYMYYDGGSTVEFATPAQLFLQTNTSTANMNVMHNGNSAGTYLALRTQTTSLFIYRNGNFHFGASPQAGSGTNSLLLESGTAPSTNVTDKCYIYSQDVVAGNAAPHFRTENGSIVKLYQNSAVTTPQGIADALTNLGLLASSTVPEDPAGWTTIVKSANQDVTNNATLVTDTDLQFSVVAGGHYMIELDAVISSSSTAGDYKNAFNVSAGTQKAHGLLIGTSQAGNAGTFLYNANAAATSTNLTIGTIMNDLDGLFSLKVIYSFTASANATFRYQFAQNTATAAQTARTWKGSILKYKRID